MFFTPGRVIGLILVVAAIVVIGYLLQRLDTRIQGSTVARKESGR